MTRKIRLGLLFGGRSAEHEVSLMSARSVLRAIDAEKYDVTLIGITKDGKWIAIACTNDKIFERLAVAMGRPELAAPDRWGRIAAVAIFVGFQVTFFPQFLAGSADVFRNSFVHQIF